MAHFVALDQNCQKSSQMVLNTKQKTVSLLEMQGKALLSKKAYVFDFLPPAVP